MDADATQESGADVGELENMFEDESGDGTQTQTGQNDATTQQQTGESGNADELDLELEVNEDGTPKDGEEVVVDADPEVKLVIDGKEVTRKQSELIAQAQKYEAAEKRFQEAAEIRKTAEATTKTATERANQLSHVLEYYIRESNQLMQEQQPNWDALINEDPKKYLLVRQQWEAKMFAVQQAANAKAELERQKANEQAVSNQQRIAQERDKLLAAIPEWKDPVKAAEGAKAIDQYLEQAGIPPEMRAQIDSAPVLVIARKAWLYDQAIAKQKAARATSAQPKALQASQARVVRPGAATTVQPASRKNDVARANAVKSFESNPSVDTLASFFE